MKIIKRRKEKCRGCGVKTGRMFHIDDIALCAMCLTRYGPTLARVCARTQAALR